MEYLVGIDLHGTLLNKEEKIEKGIYKNLITTLKSKPKNMSLFICTGNDLPFVKRKLGDILRYFDGSILETGAVVSYNNIEETIISNLNDVEKFSSLQKTLEEENFKEVYKFARRLTSISLFVNYGESVEKFYNKVLDFLKPYDFSYFRVTYSSVAVDIVPKNFDKYTGMRHVSSSATLIGIADSLNDREMLKKCDIAFLPSNYNTLLPSVTGKDSVNIKNYSKSCLNIADYDTTKGVDQILNFIFEKYGER
ncbi:MAG: hypothetical protein CR982_03155 [Candidatus Cloacimonadota bacterium]|nr:MAG: hypothetical protein CR982_03155 [Candidatus Cloacimonadota bacterium]PIE77426.1 MAG: hypothetical protein CSA15_13180 [Candidatus Delongbacteria bacterium]